MQHLMTPDCCAILRSGPEPYTTRPTDPERGALFVCRRPLRSMTVLVDHSLNNDANHDPVVAYLLGLISAWDADASPSTPGLHRFWYADGGPPQGVQRQPRAWGEGEFIPDWVMVNWSDREEARSITYAMGNRISRSALQIQDNLLDAVERETPPAPYAGLSDPPAQMRADLVAAWAARALHADVFVTKRDFLFETPFAENLETLILRPSEALPLIGLYRRQQGQFITFTSPDGRCTESVDNATFYRVAAQELVPALWRWRAAFRQHASATQEEMLSWLAFTLMHRLGQVLATRDRIHAMLFRPQQEGIEDDVLAEFDQMNLLLMAAFDNAARVAHHTIPGLTLDPYDAGWRRSKWMKELAKQEPGLANVVRAGTAGTSGDHLLTILGTFRNTIHGALLPLKTVHDSGLPPDIHVAVPRQAAQKVLAAMDALGGRSAWGVDQETASPGALDTFVRPGPLVEQMVRHATNVLDDLLAATPVEQLSGVNLQPSDLVRPADPNDPFAAQSAQRILWQLGL